MCTCCALPKEKLEPLENNFVTGYWLMLPGPFATFANALATVVERTLSFQGRLYSFLEMPSTSIKTQCRPRASYDLHSIHHTLLGLRASNRHSRGSPLVIFAWSPRVSFDVQKCHLGISVRTLMLATVQWEVTPPS
jgi:hypothetical protein